ncbi:unnamed protein product [Sphagnum balticum]
MYGTSNNNNTRQGKQCNAKDQIPKSHNNNSNVKGSNANSAKGSNNNNMKGSNNSNTKGNNTSMKNNNISIMCDGKQATKKNKCKKT